MKNTTVDNLAKHTEVQEVLNQFGVRNYHSIHLAGGTSSPKWAVNSDKGRFVVRVRPAEFRDLSHIRFDHEAMIRLSQAGLPAPDPLACSNGTTWLSKNGKVYEVLHWVDGEQFDESNINALAGLGRFLARFHRAIGMIPAGKEGCLREDHPDIVEPYLLQLRQQANGVSQKQELDKVECELKYIRKHMDDDFLAPLPRCIIHGDVHPGNLRFRGPEVSAVYDFDYLSVQSRIRDVADGLIFFAATRKQQLNASDIHSLTQPFVLNLDKCRILLRGYQETVMLTDHEWQAISLFIRSRWIQMRLRGTRKISTDEKIRFVLDGFFEVIEWLNCDSRQFFEELRKSV